MKPTDGFCERQTVSSFIVDEKQRQEYNNKRERKTGRERAAMENQRDFCNECGGEMGIPGLMDYNMKEIDEQYRSFRAQDGQWEYIESMI